MPADTRLRRLLVCKHVCIRTSWGKESTQDVRQIFLQYGQVFQEPFRPGDLDLVWNTSKSKTVCNGMLWWRVSPACPSTHTVMVVVTNAETIIESASSWRQEESFQIYHGLLFGKLLLEQIWTVAVPVTVDSDSTLVF